MNTPSEIIKAWWIAANPSKEQSELARERLSICMKPCDYLQESIVFEYVCGACGCPIRKKIFTANKKACPKEKWNEVEDKSYLK